MGRKKEIECGAADAGRLLAELRSPDEAVRADAVRSLCPCHAGWEVFERHVGVVMRALRDESRGVRAHALHVFEDAARMQGSEEFGYYVEEAAERLRKKRASRFRPAETAAEARRVSELRMRGRRPR